MKTYTVHLRARSTPVLVAEGFSWGAFFFGGFWLLTHRAWIAGVIALAAGVALLADSHGPARVALAVAYAVLLGLIGRDVLRWSLDMRGFTLAHVVGARDRDAALLRLLAGRPDLATSLGPDPLG